MLAPFTLLNNGEGGRWTRDVSQDINDLPTFLGSRHFHAKQLPALVYLCLRAFSKAEKGCSVQVFKLDMLKNGEAFNQSLTENDSEVCSALFPGVLIRFLL